MMLMRFWSWSQSDKRKNAVCCNQSTSYSSHFWKVNKVNNDPIMIWSTINILLTPQKNKSCDVRYKIQSSLILQKEVRSYSLQCINCMLVEMNLIVIFVVHYSSLFKSDLNIEHSHRCIIVTFLCMRNMTRTLTTVCVIPTCYPNNWLIGHRKQRFHPEEWEN